LLLVTNQLGSSRVSVAANGGRFDGWEDGRQLGFVWASRRSMSCAVAPGVEEIRALGGNEVICHEDEDLGKRVHRDRWSGRRVKGNDCVAGHRRRRIAFSRAPVKMIVYGARSRRIAKPSRQAHHPIFAGRIIYETKIVQGFFLPRWFATAPQEQIKAAVGETFELVASEYSNF